jgi:uncharacterized membrane protein YccC
MANIGKITSPTLLNAARTTSAAVLSMLLSRMLKLPEFYWAPIAAITVSIILLIAHQRAAWIVAWHRFLEVSLGIAVGLALALLWPIKGQ